jgi:ADP-heptose:LPS heptosyltransferase
VATVARRWRAQGGAVVVLQGPAEPSSWDGDADAIVAGRSLPQVAALLAACDAYLGNDSGISHLAGAVGARGVVVFGPTAPARWRPPSPRLHVVAPARPGPIAAIAATDVLRALDGVIP